MNKLDSSGLLVLARYTLNSQTLNGHLRASDEGDLQPTSHNGGILATKARYAGDPAIDSMIPASRQYVKRRPPIEGRHQQLAWPREAEMPVGPRNPLAALARCIRFSDAFEAHR